MNWNSFCSWYIDDDEEEQILQKPLPSFPNIYKEIDHIFFFHLFNYTYKTFIRSYHWARKFQVNITGCLHKQGHNIQIQHY